MSLEVHVSDCEGVDPSEVERLLGLELAFVATAPVLREPLTVDLSCSGTVLRITATDPITQRLLSREIALGPREPGRERTIALLASQLFVTSWAESFVERPPEGAEPVPPATREAAPPAGRAAHELELLVGVGVRVRDVSNPRAGERAALRGSVGFGHVRALVTLAYERGETRDAAGSVAWSMESAGVGLAWRSGRLGPVALEGSGTVSIVGVDARGEDARAGVAASSAQGFLGEASVGLGPVVYLGPVRLGLEAQLGVTLPAATARTPSVGDDVALGGLWAGVTLVAGAAGSAW